MSIFYGRHATIEILKKYPKEVSRILIPQNYSHTHNEELVKLAELENIPIEFNTPKLKGFVNKSNRNVQVVGFFKKDFHPYLKLNDIEGLIDGRDKITCVAIQNIEYDENLAAIMRSALALKADFLMVSNNIKRVFSPNITKISMGYNFVIPIVKGNLKVGVKRLRSMGFQVLALDTEGANITDFRYNRNVCFLLGEEKKGLNAFLLSEVDEKLSIPINREVESLNVNSALSIALYDRISKKTE